MNSEETYLKISKRNKNVISCGHLRNNTYAEYLNASLSYDNLKKAFYIAIQLSRYDNNVPEERKEISNEKICQIIIHKNFRITTV